MDPITIGLIVLIFAGGAYLLTRILLITAKWIKEKIKMRLKQRKVNKVFALTMKEFKELANTAHKGKLEDLDALNEMMDDEIMVSNVTDSGEISGVERIKGDKGMEKNLSDYLNQNDGMVIFES